MIIPSRNKIIPLVLFLVLLIAVVLGIYLALQQQVLKSRAAENKSLLASSEGLDPRAGLSGNCAIVSAMGIEWFYNWGTGHPVAGGYPNQNEYECHNSFPNLKFFYSIGLEGLGAWFKTGSNTEINVNPEFEKYTTKFIDQEDRDNYRLLQDLDLYKRINFKNDFILYSYLLIPKYAVDNPGAVYGIGNEPDLNKLTPEEYAKMYHIYYTRIKKFDPTAKVMVKGLTTVSMDQNNNWARQFREAYKNLYHQYPQVDIWSIHPYATLGGGNGQQTINYIKDFRDNFLKEIGEPNAELWLTEFGPAGDRLPPNNSLGWDRDIAQDYMPNVMNFLKETNYVQKWFYYVAQNSYWTFFEANGHLKPEYNCTYDPNRQNDPDHRCILKADGTLATDSRYLRTLGYPEIGDIWCVQPDNCSTVNAKGEVYKKFVHQEPFAPVDGGGKIGSVNLVILNFGGTGGQANGDQNSDNKVNELDFGAVYSR